MPKIEDTIEVQVPVRQAYNQWTQFEEFPAFMEGIQSVQQLDDTHVQWVAEIRGESRQWTTEITEQRPDEKIAWKTIEGEVKNDGVVTFEPMATLGRGSTCRWMSKVIRRQRTSPAISWASSRVRCAAISSGSSS